MQRGDNAAVPNVFIYFPFFLKERCSFSPRNENEEKKRLPTIKTRTGWHIFLTNETPISVHVGFDAGQKVLNWLQLMTERLISVRST